MLVAEAKNEKFMAFEGLDEDADMEMDDGGELDDGGIELGD